jgi:hypothetical protein
MKDKTSNGLRVSPLGAQAANKEFPAALRDAAPPGWSAYEVWRVRVKNVQNERIASTFS